MTDEGCAEYLEFYRRYFDTESGARQFVEECESKTPSRHPSRLIMHQCQRLVSVARDVSTLHPAYHSLQVFLLLTCAEAVAKLHTARGRSGDSKNAVRRFFEELLPAEEQARLIAGLRASDGAHLPMREIADGLYQVRCDAAHEGQYWSVFFSNDGITTGSRGWPLWASITLEQMYDVVVAGCVAAARGVLHSDREVPEWRRS